MKLPVFLICLMLFSETICAQESSIQDRTIRWQIGQTYAQIRSGKSCSQWVESKNRLDAVCSFGEGNSQLPTQFYFDNSALQKASITLYQGDGLKAAGDAFGLGFDWLKGSAWGVDAPSVEMKDKDGKTIPYSNQTADRVSRDYVEMIGKISSSESDNPKGFVVTLFQQSERPIQGTMLCNTVYRSSRGIFFVTMWLLDPALPNQTCPVAREEIEATSIPPPEAFSGIKHK